MIKIIIMISMLIMMMMIILTTINNDTNYNCDSHEGFCNGRARLLLISGVATRGAQEHESEVKPRP